MTLFLTQLCKDLHAICTITGVLLAPVSVGIITDKHYAKNSITKFNDRSDNGTCDPATRNCNKQKNPLRIEQGKRLVE